MQPWALHTPKHPQSMACHTYGWYSWCGVAKMWDKAYSTVTTTIRPPSTAHYCLMRSIVFHHTRATSHWVDVKAYVQKAPSVTAQCMFAATEAYVSYTLYPGRHCCCSCSRSTIF